MDVLKKYVEERQIDVIAITNHNMFDLEQYKEIVSKLPDTIVFPGIEINIGNNAGHLLVIARQDDVEEFAHRCENVQKEIKTEKDSITVEQLKAFFGKLVVVTNLGSISYLVKGKAYVYEKAVTLFNEAVNANNEAKDLKGLQRAADYFFEKLL